MTTTTRIPWVGPLSSAAVYELAGRAIDSGLTIPQQAALILERELLRPKRRRNKAIAPGLVQTAGGPRPPSSIATD
jgi:hypothetical protein